MTVASLWKALDRAGCGKPVGATDLRNHHNHLKKFSPFNPPTPCRPPTLAVDLSIWICESLTTAAMSDNHMDPTLHLVYTRTLYLLNLGIQLVGVLEGKRRIRSTDETSDQFQKRRSGTAFWAACQKCEELLKYLGVPVVRASAEGEALCAFLNEKGIVDGVISSDGDCFLFGAKVLYTKFSLENIRQGNVMRYDISSLRAMLDDDDRDDADKLDQPDTDGHDFGIVSLTRNDLIAFAILTGSDIAGGGIDKVGCRKALRFIRKAQLDNPMRTEDAALTELFSWGKVARVDEASGSNVLEKSGPCCSSCCHSGTKRSHLKDGCQKCGTGPGEPCLPASPGAKFRKKLKAKVMGMKQLFDPESITSIYRSPNAGQLPLTLVGKTAADVRMQTPDLSGILKSSLVIRGRSYLESRNYILKSLPPLLAKATLSSLDRESTSLDTTMKLPVNRNVPTPKEILREMSRLGQSCYAISWTVNASVSDNEGNPVDNFEFTTIENQQIVQMKLPALVEEYRNSMKLKWKQGNTEQIRRQEFLESMLSKHKSLNAELNANNTTRAFQDDKTRNMNCDKILPHVIVVDNTRAELSPQRDQRAIGFYKGAMSDDAQQLLRFINPLHRNMDSGSTVLTEQDEGSWDGSSIRSGDLLGSMACDSSPYKLNTTPGHLYFLRCHRCTDPQERFDTEQEPNFKFALSLPEKSWLDKSPPLKKPCAVETPLQLGSPKPLNLGLLFSNSLKLDREKPMNETRDTIPTSRLLRKPQSSQSKSILVDADQNQKPNFKFALLPPEKYWLDKGPPLKKTCDVETPMKLGSPKPLNLDLLFSKSLKLYREKPMNGYEGAPSDAPYREALDTGVHFTRSHSDARLSHEFASITERETCEDAYVGFDEQRYQYSAEFEHNCPSTHTDVRGSPNDHDMWYDAWRKAEASPWSESYYNSIVSLRRGEGFSRKSEGVSPPLCSQGLHSDDVVRSANRYDDIPLQKGDVFHEKAMEPPLFDDIDQPSFMSYLPTGLRTPHQPKLNFETKNRRLELFSSGRDGDKHVDPDVVQAAMARLEKKCILSREYFEYNGLLREDAASKAMIPTLD